MPLAVSLTPNLRAALNSVLTQRAPANKMRFQYFLGSYDLTPYVIEAEWGRTGSDQPAIAFTGRFKRTVPEALKNETMNVNLEIETSEGPVVVRRFSGRVDELMIRRGLTTVEAQTGGFWLDKIRFDEDGVSYTDWPLSSVVWDVVTRAASAGVYQMSFADIETVEGPSIRRDEFLAISRIDKLSRPLDAAVEEGELFFRDSPYNAPLCHRDKGPAEASDVLVEYVIGVDVDPDGFEPAATSDQFYDVVVYQTDPDTGAITYLFEPILIPNSLAPKGVGYEISVTDDTPTAQEDAYALAQKVAGRLIHGESTARFALQWPHPLMVDGDFVSIVEPFQEAERSGSRYWIGQVEVNTQRHDLTSEIEVTMVRRREAEDPVVVVGALPPARLRGV